MTEEGYQSGVASLSRFAIERALRRLGDLLKERNRTIRRDAQVQTHVRFLLNARGVDEREGVCEYPLG